MRLVGQIKAGFYPTPPTVTQLVRTWLRFSDKPFAALDPCAGEGVALAQVLAGTGGIGYGMELDRVRARDARTRLAHVLTGDWGTGRASVAAFSLCWCNPPCDDETGDDGGRAERKEHAWLRDVVHYLKPGGVLVYILPQQRLYVETARLLAYRFEGLRAFRFPDGEYRAFGQCVILGTKRKSGMHDPEAEQAMLAFATQGEAAPALAPRPHGEPAVEVPVGGPVKLFAGGVIDPEALLAELPASRLWARARELTGTARARPAGRPPVLLHRGHLALLLAAGEIDGALGAGDSRHVVRGTVRKYTSVSEEEDDQGNVVRREVESLPILVRTLALDGTVRTLE